MYGDAYTISADLDAMTEVTALIEARSVTTLLQPMVRMATREVVGYEALARGPAGTRWESPVELFCAATMVGRRAELDWICRARAVEAALEADLPHTCALFVNTEPETCGTACPPDLRPILARARGRVRLMLELTERAVSSEPAALLHAAAVARRGGHGVAFDNVGGDPAVLALIALAQPDVIKLDPYLLCRPLCAETSRVVEAVNDYVERCGAVVAAAGIETEAQVRVARAMGATVGQGWYFGRPDRTLAPSRVAAESLWERVLGSGVGPRHPRMEPTRADVVVGGVTPFEMVTASRPVARASAAMLLPVARRMEGAAFDVTQPSVVLVSLRSGQALSAELWDWYSALGRGAALLALGGAGLAGSTVPGAVVEVMEPSDRMADEWDVIVVGPRFCGALVARERPGPHLPGGAHPSAERLDYAITYDRDLVLAAAQAFLTRLAI